jgi:hypothetical protein
MVVRMTCGFNDCRFIPRVKTKHATYNVKAVPLLPPKFDSRGAGCANLKGHG